MADCQLCQPQAHQDPPGLGAGRFNLTEPGREHSSRLDLHARPRQHHRRQVSLPPPTLRLIIAKLSAFTSLLFVVPFLGTQILTHVLWE